MDEDSPIDVLDANEKRRIIDLSGYRSLAEYIGDLRPDIVQANSGDTLKYAVISKLLYSWKGKLVFRNASKMGDYINSRAKRIYNQQLINRVDFVASVSENSRRDFLRTFSYPSNKTRTLTIGTPMAEPLEQEKIAEIKRKLEVSGQMIVNVGSFTFEKNHLGLLEIFSRVLKNHPNSKLVLVGDGGLRPKIEAAIAHKNLSKSVILTGFRRDAVDILGAADVMLMPSNIEGMPGVILEAMMRGVPVIASAVGGIPEVIINGQTGVVIPSEDVDSFVKKTEELLNSKAERETLSGGARSFVMSKTIARISGEFHDAYQELLLSAC